MDVLNWKKVLLQWISECGFVDKQFYNVEQSDIESFYLSFCKHHFKAGTIANDVIPVKEQLLFFLQEYYPEFKPLLDDDNGLSTSDYYFVYSLFLHFSCVKYPEKFFHEKCQKLSNYSQTCIATFCKRLVECTTSINKEILRQAIADIDLNSSGSPRVAEISFDASNGSGSSNGNNISSSPSSTPRRQSLTKNQRISPATPRTSMLEERQRELYSLKAQLETERYEKSLLEVQLKQNEEKIQQLNQDHRKLQNTIQALKNDITYCCNEPTSVAHDEDALKRRLRRLITQNENEIANLNDLIGSLKEEKNTKQQQLELANKKIINFSHRIEELEVKVEQLITELTIRDNTILTLRNNNLDLENYIQEMRLNVPHEASSDNLDTSSSPENMCKAVIDLQLKERIAENSQIRKELEHLRASSNRVALQIQEFAVQNSERLLIPFEDLTPSPDQIQNPTELYDLFINCMDNLFQNLQIKDNDARKYRNDAVALQKENQELCTKIEHFERELSNLHERVSAVEALNMHLERSKTEFQKNWERCQRDVEMFSRQKIELVRTLEALVVQNGGDKAEANVIDFSEQIGRLQGEIERHRRESTEMSQNNMLLKEETASLELKYLEVQEQLILSTQEKDRALATLRDRIETQMQEIHSLKAAEQSIKEKYENLLVECDVMNKRCRQSDKHLQTMQSEMTLKSKEILKLGKQITATQQKKELLQKNIEKILSNLHNERETSKLAIDEKCERLSAVENELDLLKATLNDGKKELESTQNALQKSETDMEVIRMKCHELAKILDLGTDLNIVDYLEMCEKKFNNLHSTIRNLEEQHGVAINKCETLVVEQMAAKLNLHEIEEALAKVEAEKEKLAEDHLKMIDEASVELKANTQERIACQKEMERLLKENNEKQKEFEERYAKLRKELEKERAQRQKLEKNQNVSEKLRKTEIELKRVIEEKHEVEQRYNTEFSQLGTKVTTLLAENQINVDKMNQLCREYSEAKIELEKSEKEVKKLAEELCLANTEKVELKSKLHAKEMDFLQLEENLEKKITEKSHSLEELHKDYDKQTEMLDQAKQQLGELERVRDEKLFRIIELESVLNRTDAVCTKLQTEEQRRSSLIKTLESTNKELKEMLQQKSEKTQHLRAELANMEIKYREACDKHQRMSKDLLDKANKLQSEIVQHDIDKEKSRKQISELIEKIAVQNNELHSKDFALVDIISTLENQMNFVIESKENVENPIRNIFNADQDSPVDTTINQLKKWLNQIFDRITTLNADLVKIKEQETNAKQTIDELQDMNNKLKEIVAYHKMQLKDLEKKYETSLEENKRINQLRNEQENKCENLLKCNEELRAKNAKYEEELVDLKLSMDSITQLKKLQRADKQFQEELVMQKNQLLQTLENRIDTIQQLEAKCEALTKDLNVKNDLVYTMQKDSEFDAEKLQKSNENNEILLNELKQMKDEINTMTKKYEETKKQMEDENLRYQNEIKTMEKKCDELNMDYDNKITALTYEKSDLVKKNDENCELNVQLNAEIVEKTEKCKELAEKLENLTSENTNLIKDKEVMIEHLNEALDQKHKQFVICGELIVKHEQLGIDYETCKTDYAVVMKDVERLTAELNTLKELKQNSDDEIKNFVDKIVTMENQNKELQQKIDTINFEKESLIKERDLLLKQIDTNNETCTTTEVKMKTVNIQCQQLERDMLASEKELQVLRTAAEKLKNEKAKLVSENTKLLETNANSTKRVEMLALKLGQVQADCAKMERENEKQQKMLQNKLTAIESQQREKETILNELKVARERLNKAEMMRDQLIVKLETQEKTQQTLLKAKKTLEASDVDNKMKIKKLEKMRDVSDEKIRKLDNELNATEQKTVRLNHEIGALNSKICELQQKHKIDLAKELEKHEENLKAAKTEAEELNTKLENELKSLREQNKNISEQLTTTSEALNTAKEQIEVMKRQIQQLTLDISYIRVEKENVQEQHRNTCERMDNILGLNEQLKKDKENIVSKLETKLAEALQCSNEKLNEMITMHGKQLYEKSTIIAELEAKISKAQQQHKIKIDELIAENQKVTNEKSLAIAELEEKLSTLQLFCNGKCKEVELLQNKIDLLTATKINIESNTVEFEKVQARFALAQEMLTKEQTIANQLRMDNQILQAKYREAKQRLLDEAKTSEERIKENRLELEGKLEKMKIKMKALYNDEMQKLSTKQEREKMNFKEEIEKLEKKCAKYVEQIKTLSEQMVKVNDQLLAEQKRNTILSTKLKYLEEDAKSFKRPIHVSTISSTAPTPSNLGTNLRMEDEEGEIFNNTYLTDMKNGRMSEIFGDELKYRNSLVLPHLKSAYAAQYDLGLAEDELKVSVHNKTQNNSNNNTTMITNKITLNNDCNFSNNNKRENDNSVNNDDANETLTQDNNESQKIETIKGRHSNI